MKFIRPILVTFGLITILSGCSFFETKEPVPAATPAEIKLEKKTGIILMGAGQTDSSKNTFTLTTDSGESIVIDSANINLKRYTKRRVEAEGKRDPEKATFLVENVTAIGNETESKQPYENAEFGVKFQYPSIWTLQELKNISGVITLLITPYEVADSELTNVDRITIERWENNTKSTAQQWLKLDDQYRPTDSFDSSTYQKSLIGPGQVEGVKRTSVQGDKIEFYVSRDTFMYRIAHSTIGDADKDLYRNAFYDIAQLFEFIPFGKNPVAALTITSTPESPSALLPIKPTIIPLVPPSSAVTIPVTKPAPNVILAKQKQSFVSYISVHIGDLAGQAATKTGSWLVTKMVFAAPEAKPEEFSAIYVYFQDGDDRRRLLLSVTDRTKADSVTKVALFVPGDTTDWKLSEGTDTAKDLEKTIISVGASSENSEEVVVKKGMTLLDAKSIKIKLQYPNSYYWAFANKGYTFDSKPVSGDGKFRLTNDAGDAAASLKETGEVGGKKISEGSTSDGKIVLCLAGKNLYCLTGNLDSKETMNSMRETITEY